MKTLALLLFYLTIPFFTNGQDPLEGRFRRTALYTQEILEFKPDGTFSFYQMSCGLAYSGKGQYFFNKKNLSLEFDSQLDKTIGVFSQVRKKDKSNTQSTVQVFDGYKHRNDIQFKYMIYYANSLVEEGSGDAHHSLNFYPDQVDSMLVTTFFLSNDSHIIYQENRISIESSIAYNYTLLSLPKGGPMFVGKSHNKQYKIRLNRTKTEFKIQDSNNTWIEYKLIQN